MYGPWSCMVLYGPVWLHLVHIVLVLPCRVIVRSCMILQSHAWSLSFFICSSISENCESLVKVSVSTTLVQFRSVSVSTTIKFSSLDWSRYRQPWKNPVSKSLGLDNLNFSESRPVSVSTTWKFLSLVKSWSRQLPYKNNDNFHIKLLISKSYQVTSICW